ncbi:MAG: DUF2796 domain-containing protein [Pseudomonadota bacterium]
MADRRKKTALSLTAAMSIMLLSAHASEDGHDHNNDHYTHEAHVHGAWELFAALDDKKLSVTVKGPIVDALGFERPPATQEERTAIKDLKTGLDAPEKLFALSKRARCSVEGPAQIALPKGFSEDLSEIEQPGEDGDDHHGHNEHDTEGDYSDHDIHSSDLEVSYIFNCEAPARLTEITVNVFDIFPDIDNIDAVFLSDTRQSARRLKGDSKSFNVK